MKLRHIIAMAALSVFAPSAIAQPGGDLLDQAYAALASGDYALAARDGRAYLSAYPRLYDAEFAVAVGDCMAPMNGVSGPAELQGLIDAYALDAASLAAVRYWQGNCRAPPPPPQQQASDVGESSQGLTQPPPPNQIRRPGSPPHLLPTMSALAANTSFSGDDYWHMTSSSAAACAQSCRFEDMCRSMTYIISTHVCFLKRSVPPAQHGSDFVSSYKR